MRPETLANTFALDVQGLERLEAQAARDPRATLEEAARQFEALFVQIMLKSMREAVPQSGLLHEGPAARLYDSLMDQQWSLHLAGKGLGLAEQLTAELEGFAARPPSSE